MKFDHFYANSYKTPVCRQKISVLIWRPPSLSKLTHLGSEISIRCTLFKNRQPAKI